MPQRNPSSPVRFRNPKYHVKLRKASSSNGSTRAIGKLHTTESLTVHTQVWPVANFRFPRETLNEDLRPWFDVRTFPVIISVMTLKYKDHIFRYDFTTPISAEINNTFGDILGFSCTNEQRFLKQMHLKKICHRSCCLPEVKPKSPLNC